LSYFYEIRSADNTVLKRDGGFPSQEAAKEAARADAKKIESCSQTTTGRADPRRPERPDHTPLSFN
jgi:hypothetical protein